MEKDINSKIKKDDAEKILYDVMTIYEKMKQKRNNIKIHNNDTITDKHDINIGKE